MGGGYFFETPGICEMFGFCFLRLISTVMARLSYPAVTTGCGEIFDGFTTDSEFVKFDVVFAVKISICSSKVQLCLQMYGSVS